MSFISSGEKKTTPKMPMSSAARFTGMPSASTLFLPAESICIAMVWRRKRFSMTRFTCAFSAPNRIISLSLDVLGEPKREAR